MLDEATGKWGIRVNRVELKAIDPPGIDPGVDGEADARRARQARRDPERRGREAVADPGGRGLEAERDPASRGTAAGDDSRRRGPGEAIATVFAAIHAGDADPKLLAYQYLQMLPQIAQGESNKLWIIPSEFANALGKVGEAAGVQQPKLES